MGADTNIDMFATERGSNCVRTRHTHSGQLLTGADTNIDIFASKMRPLLLSDICCCSVRYVEQVRVTMLSFSSSTRPEAAPFGAIANLGWWCMRRCPLANAVANIVYELRELLLVGPGSLIAAWKLEIGNLYAIGLTTVF